MHKSFGTIFLLLFLCLLPNIVLVSYCYSDFRNSLQSDSLTVLDPVMAPKMRYTKTKRLLQQHHGENYNDQEKMQDIYDGQNFGAGIIEAEGTVSGIDGHYESKSRTSKRASKLATTKNSRYLDNHCTSECDNANVFQHQNKRFRSDEQNATVTVNQSSFTDSNSDFCATETLQHLERSNSSQFLQTDEMRCLIFSINGQYSHSFGQALYQRSRKGLIVKYEDSGDNVYECDYCNANFWFGEAIKQSSSNAPLIYTNCCKKGQIKLQDPKPTPIFLERLLDPNKGSESKLFRENIRVYNSMFSFTSMGATIDRKINTGSGPYVFKISGQVHHLMGSILPSDGESPKYAQLYIYDTKNEVSNRISAIDPTHVNKSIQPDIVKELIKMFDEDNELVKEFRTMRDKFENNSVPLLNMSILNRQPTDSKQYEEPTSEEIAGLIVGDIGEHNSNKDIIIESNSGQLQRISKIHPKYMSLQYPILFPYGEDGYKTDLLMQQITENSKKKTESINASLYYISNPRWK